MVSTDDTEYGFPSHPNVASTMTRQQPQPDWTALRNRMVSEQLCTRGITNEDVLDAMRRIPRERFVSPDHLSTAYHDRALPIDLGQTVSQPYIVAYMTEQLQLHSACRVLEIGTGTGYQTAVLACLCERVYTVERYGQLSNQAMSVLADLDITNVTARCGDGSIGLAEFAPFDRILVTAAAPAVPEPLVEQLVDGGILIVPVGSLRSQSIHAVRRDGTRRDDRQLIGCRFVKLVGHYGWDAQAT